MDTESSRKSTDPTWLRVLNSASVAALITVVFGGILGQIIVSSFQDAGRRRDQMQAAYEEHLTESVNHIELAYGRVGAMISASENLAATTSSAWDPSQAGPERRARLEDERKRVVSAFNTTISTWQSGRESVALLMGFWLNTESHDYGESWRGVQRHVDGYLTCVKACYERTLAPTSRYGSCDCDSLKNAAWRELSAFNKSVRQSRIYAQEDWK